MEGITMEGGNERKVGRKREEANIKYAAALLWNTISFVVRKVYLLA